MVNFRKLINPYKSLTGGQKEETPAKETEKPTPPKPDVEPQLIPAETEEQKKSFLDPYTSFFKKKKVQEKTVEGTKITTTETVPDVTEIKFDRIENPLYILIKLLTIMGKDLRLLMQSKSSALIVVFGPLLVIFLVGISFNTTSLYDLRIATYSEEYSELSDNIITGLKDEQYNTVKVDSEYDCMEGVRLANYHACAIFSPGIAITSGAIDSNTIKVHVDESRMNLAFLIQNSIKKKVSAEAGKISKELIGDVTSRLSSSGEALDNSLGIIKEDILPGNSNSILLLKEVKESLDKMEEQLAKFNKDDFNISKVRMYRTMVITELNKTDVACMDKTEDTKGWGGMRAALEELDTQMDDIWLNVIVAAKKEKEISSESAGKVSESVKLTQNEMEILRDAISTILATVSGAEITDVEQIAEPVKTTAESVAGKKTHLSFMFPTFIILILMFISILLSSTVTVREKTSKAYFRNFIMPTSDFIFMLGGYLTNMLIVLIQIAVIFASAYYFLGAELIPIIGQVLLVLLLVSSVFVTIGMLMGFLFKSEETATLGAISLSSIMLFFSSTILPIETLPVGIREIARYNPFVISESILKKLMLFNVPFENIAYSVYMLLCFFLIFFVLAFLVRELTKRRFA